MWPNNMLFCMFYKKAYWSVILYNKLSVRTLCKKDHTFGGHRANRPRKSQHFAKQLKFWPLCILAGYCAFFQLTCLVEFYKWHNLIFWNIGIFPSCFPINNISPSIVSCTMNIIEQIFGADKSKICSFFLKLLNYDTFNCHYWISFFHSK